MIPLAQETEETEETEEIKEITAMNTNEQNYTKILEERVESLESLLNLEKQIGNVYAKQAEGFKHRLDYEQLAHGKLKESYQKLVVSSHETTEKYSKYCGDCGIHIYSDGCIDWCSRCGRVL